ncbi:uncharacterized protein LOC143018293 isoform X2 [Oratosquilla oratoria]|uniref:uncharacterized protein LOC143018293 isoform X2 n=1 Tax=Oratosquilla oratoria TaxID=337810 RepID=UPI003F75ED0C
MPTVRTLVVCIGLMSVMAGVGKCRIPFHKASKDSHAMQEAFGLIVAALENLDSRLTTIENRFGIPDSKLSSSRVPAQEVVGQGDDPETAKEVAGQGDHSETAKEVTGQGDSLEPAKEVAGQGDDPDNAQEVVGQGDDPDNAQEVVGQGDDPDNAQEVAGQGDDPDNAQGEFLQTSGSTVNRLGEVESRPCPNANFTRVPITGRCYYMSVINKDRKHWEEARASCQSMEATLAEPRGALFWHVVSFLAKNEKTAGFGFWVGGVYLGNWFWINSGEVVSLDSNFWSYRDNEDIIRPPGDIEGGKCLTLRYVLEEKSYAYTADQCGYTKYYLCEMLEKTHRLYF